MRLDDAGQLFILEANSLPSLGEHGSYLVAPTTPASISTGFVNRLVDIADRSLLRHAQRLTPGRGREGRQRQILQYITQNREGLERRLRDWVQLSSTTNDPWGSSRRLRRRAVCSKGSV